MDFEIKEYRQEHEEAVKDLLVELQKELISFDDSGILAMKENYRDGYFDFVSNECKIHDGKIYIATISGKVVGVVTCIIKQGEEEDEFISSCPKIGFVIDLIIKEKYRNKGIGKALIGQTEDYFKSQGCEYMQLDVLSNNRKAIEIYEDIGFETNLYKMSKKI